MSDVASLAAATPDNRDRYVDFLRVASLLGVILGHFVMAAVIMDQEAQSFAFTNILELAPWTRWGTLLLHTGRPRRPTGGSTPRRRRRWTPTPPG